MRVIVTGSRSWNRRDVIWEALDATAAQAAAVGDSELVVVHGACPSGGDLHADRWVLRQVRLRTGGLRTIAERHPALWADYGRPAGRRRNAKMASLGADLCLAFLRDNSAGTTHMIRVAEKAGIPTKVTEYDQLPGEATHV